MVMYPKKKIEIKYGKIPYVLSLFQACCHEHHQSLVGLKNQILSQIN